MTGFDLETWLAGTTELDTVIRAVAREEAIRDGMAATGESREIVAETLDALISMDQEAVEDLMDGEPTTLSAGLARYIEELEKRDELLPRDGIVTDLETLFAYPFPGRKVVGVETLTRQIHEAYVRLAPGLGFEVVEWDDLLEPQRELARQVVRDVSEGGLPDVKQD